MKRVVGRVRTRMPETRFVNYVAPSVWVWRPGRAREIARLYDLQLTLLPFEPPWFEAAGTRAVFVGHPAVEGAERLPARMEARESMGIAPDRPVLLALPGSRRGEIARLGNIFQNAIARVVAKHPDLLVLVPAAHGVESEARRFARGCRGDVRLLSAASDAGREHEKARAFRAADLALAASGSVVLELAVARVPAVIAYRFSPVTWMLGRFLTRHRTASLVNILLGDMVQPEFLQQDCRSGPIAAELLACLTDPERAEAQRRAADRAVRKVRIEGTPAVDRSGARGLVGVRAFRNWQGSSPAAFGFDLRQFVAPTVLLAIRAEPAPRHSKLQGRGGMGREGTSAETCRRIWQWECHPMRRGSDCSCLNERDGAGAPSEVVRTAVRRRIRHTAAHSIAMD